MPRSLGAFVALWFLFVTSAAAQAPRVTSSGDPSVRSDSIYRLTVDPKDYPEEDYVLLLDDGIVKLEADGRATTTFRQIVQVFNDDAVERFSEQSFGWSPETEKFRLNWIRVLRPDGTVISEGAAQSQEADVPVAMGDPVYSARKRLRLTLSGVAPGTIVDYSYTTEETKNWIPGDFSLSWQIHTGVPTRRSRYILDAPAGMKLNITERNLTFPVRRATPRGRQVLTWATNDLPVIKGQSLAAFPRPKFMSLWITGTASWEGIGNWYAGLAKDRYAVTPVVRAAMDSVVAGAKSQLDTLRAIHKWVAQDIRYVSISLGLGGYQPRAPQDVVTTGFGDCKDKATLFVAALRQWGFTASPVLLSATGGVDSLKPTISQFDHVIARVDLASGPVYADLTASTIPFGELPLSIEGSLGVLVPLNGTAQRVTFPKMPITAHLFRTELTGTIDTLGRITGSMTVTTKGSNAAGLRANYQITMDSTTKSNTLRRVAQSIYEGARGDSLQLFDGTDLQAPPVIRLWLSNGKALQRSGRAWILPNPLGTMAEQEQSAQEIEKEDERDGGRWAPIDVQEATGQTTIEIVVKFILPPGWTAEVPTSVHYEGTFGTYTAEYKQEGREFSARRWFVGSEGTLPPEKVDELLAYLRKVAEDNTPYISVTPAGR